MISNGRASPADAGSLITNANSNLLVKHSAASVSGFGISAFVHIVYRCAVGFTGGMTTSDLCSKQSYVHMFTWWCVLWSSVRCPLHSTHHSSDNMEEWMNEWINHHLRDLNNKSSKNEENKPYSMKTLQQEPVAFFKMSEGLKYFRIQTSVLTKKLIKSKPTWF